MTIIASQVVCSDNLDTPHIMVSLGLLCCSIATHQINKMVTEKFVKYSWSETFPELWNQCWGNSRSCSSMLSQLHKPTIVVGHCYRSLIWTLKLIYYQLAVVNIKIIIVEHPLVHILCHSFPPCKCNTSKWKGSEKDPKLLWCAQEVKSVLDRFDPTFDNKGPWKSSNSSGPSLTKATTYIWQLVSRSWRYASNAWNISKNALIALDRTSGGNGVVVGWGGWDSACCSVQRLLSRGGILVLN